VNDLEHATAVCAELGETFCLTFVKGVDEAEALRRMGADPDTVAPRTGGQLPDLDGDARPDGASTAIALNLGRWAVVIEPGGSAGAGHPLLQTVSRGTDALSVSRQGQGSSHVGYASSGVTVVAFDPGYPAHEVTWGSDPGLLRHLMRAVGLDEPDDDVSLAVPRAMVLAQRLSGARLPARPLDGPALSARIHPWSVTPVGPGDLLSARRAAPQVAELVAVAEAAAPGTQRSVAAAEVGRLADLLGLTGTPGLADALAAAAAGTAGPVTVDSPLGGQVRGWLAAAARVDDRRDGPSDADRERAAGYRWFVPALRGVSDPDPRTAVLAALKPLGSGVAGAAEERAAVVAALRGGR
jgi:hypothetical protein